MLQFDPKTIVVGLGADSDEQVVRHLVNLLVENGYCNVEYADEVMERERQYPTGLPTEGVFVAIPHARTNNNIHKSSVGVALLAKEVPFHHIIEHDQTLDVKLVFLLANSDPEEQLDDLQALMECFGERTDQLLRMAESGSAEELYGVLCALGNDTGGEA